MILVVAFLSGESSGNTWLLKPSPSSLLGFYSLSLPFLSLLYRKETNSLELSHQQFEGTDSVKMGICKHQGLGKEKTENWNRSRSCTWAWERGPAAPPRAEAEQQLLCHGTASLGSCPGSVPGLAGQPARRALTSVAQNSCPTPAHLFDRHTVFRNCSYQS